MKTEHFIEQIEFIKTLLRKNAKDHQVHKEVKHKWPQVNKRRVAYRLVLAKRQLNEEQKEITEKARLVVLNAVEERAFDIMTLVERKAILTQIARGTITTLKAMQYKGKVQYAEIHPDFKQRIEAIAELNRIDGDYAPIRADITASAQPAEPYVAAVIHFNGQKTELLA